MVLEAAPSRVGADLGASRFFVEYRRFLAGHQRVSGKRFWLSMNNESEALGQKRLKHQATRWNPGGRSGHDVEPIVS